MKPLSGRVNLKHVMKSLGFLPLLASCMNHSDETSYVDRYLEALGDSSNPTEMPQDERILRFNAVYSNLKGANLEARISELYAEAFYFSDTLVILDSREALIQYLKRTAEDVGDIQVSMMSAWQTGPDVYVRWLMDVEFSILGQSVRSRSIGITHLRYNSTGQVIIHQDYWDSGQGFYRHIPVVGFLIQRIQARLDRGSRQDMPDI